MNSNEEVLKNAVKLATAGEIIVGALTEVLTTEEITRAGPDELPNAIIRMIVEESNV